jgi:predicted secreted hydrolase
MSELRARKIGRLGWAARIGLALALLGLAAWLAWPKAQPAASGGLVALQTSPAAGFARADGPRALAFPRDFGPHPEFQTEWWYTTGNLAAADGRRFGFELTFFRRSLLPPQDWPTRGSDWAANQVYLAHFTLSDVQAGSFRYFERSERGAAGLAGATVEPGYQVWLGNWKVAQTGAKNYHLEAQQGDVQVSLELTDIKGPVLEGIDGYSQKGADPGNASYYTSQTRLESRGTVTSGGQRFNVTGSSWMDHEYSTSALAADQVGWDWFALQLNDGSELMVYVMRKADGSSDLYSQGTLIAADGSTRRLTRDEFRVTPQARWKSPHSGADYPAAWRVEVPSAQLDVQVKPLLADQELRLSFTYWEGAVEISGMKEGKSVGGVGYVELTGYGKSYNGLF